MELMDKRWLVCRKIREKTSECESKGIQKTAA
jgi:hypothetical protein